MVLLDSLIICMTIVRICICIVRCRLSALLPYRLNSFRVKRASKLVLPTPESPIRTTKTKDCEQKRWTDPMSRRNITFEKIIVFVFTAHDGDVIDKSKEQEREKGEEREKRKKVEGTNWCKADEWVARTCDHNELQQQQQQ